jgi:arsenate reductase
MTAARKGDRNRLIVRQACQKSHRVFRIVVSVQIFGLKKSQSTRAAERFFKERRVGIQFVDLAERPMAAGEINRFIQRFGLAELLDRDGNAFETSGLKYMKLSDASLIAKIEDEPKLLRLPLVRLGNLLSVGENESAWQEMAASLNSKPGGAK